MDTQHEAHESGLKQMIPDSIQTTMNYTQVLQIKEHITRPNAINLQVNQDKSVQPELSSIRKVKNQI